MDLPPSFQYLPCVASSQCDAIVMVFRGRQSQLMFVEKKSRLCFIGECSHNDRWKSRRSLI
jgi:hypothetical protein